MIFEEQVRSMTGKEIMQAMIDGLTNPKIRIDMSSYGDVEFEPSFLFFKRAVCVGCAATNTICNIARTTFNKESITTRTSRSSHIDCSYDFLRDFEFGINNLRNGDVKKYNVLAKKIGISEISVLDKKLPELTTDGYKENLHFYQEYCDEL